MIDYVVWSPPKAHNCGGIRALYQLADLIEAEGFTVQVNPEWTSDLNRSIHIVPEVISWGPSNARAVVRWLLNRQIFATNPGDLTFVWTEALDPDKPRLAVDIIEHELFYPGEGHRAGVASYVGKGVRPAVLEGTEITKSWPAHRAELADLLRSVELLVSYDPFSALNVEATLCGTPVVIVPSEVTFGVSKWGRENQEAAGFGSYGLAYGWDELDRAKEEVGFAPKAYQSYREMISNDVTNLIEATQ